MNNKLTIEYDNKIAFHPGYYIKELIEEEEITQEEFAKKLGTSAKNISKLVNGEASISNNLAISLSNMYNTSPEVWINLQRKYEDLVNEIEKMRRIKEQSKYIDMTNYSFFHRQGFVKATKNKNEKIKELCNFFKVNSLEHFAKNDFCVNFRNEKTKITEKNIFNSNLWVETAIIKGKSYELENKFNKNKLLNSLEEIRSMTTKKPEIFYPRLKEIFKECGVAFILLEQLESSKINGAVKWLDKDKVILAINTRRKYADIFWFSLFHEIKHVLQEKYSKIILSNENNIEEMDIKLEEEADSFAKNILIPDEKYKEFLFNNDFSRESILNFAKEINIDKGIIVGRLQKEKIIPFTKYNDLKTRYIIAI